MRVWFLHLTEAEHGAQGALHLHSLETIMNSRPRTGAAALGLGLALLAWVGCDKDSAIQVHHDSQGNEQINIDQKKIKDNLHQAGRELRQGAHDLAQSVHQEASDADRRYGATARESLGDAALTAKVKARLIATPDLGGIRIHVNSRDGKVTLTGAVSSAQNRRQAEDIARRTEGVSGVDNQLQIAPASS
jgi:hyperosmotically inducible protein